MDEKEVSFYNFLSRTLNNIEKSRKEQKISYQELAYRSGIDKSNIISILKNKNNLTLKTLYKLCDALDLCVCEIIKD